VDHLLAAFSADIGGISRAGFRPADAAGFYGEMESSERKIDMLVCQARRCDRLDAGVDQ
jgi:hypothetical protein